jgi:hypothetical protein
MINENFKFKINGKLRLKGKLIQLSLEEKALSFVYEDIQTCDRGIEVFTNVEEFYIEYEEVRFYDTDGNQYILKKL